MMKKNIFKSVLISILILICLLLGIYWWIFYRKELDPSASNSPIKSFDIQIKEKKPLLSKLKMAAGIAYDKYNECFFISTDAPHSLFGEKEVKIFIVNKDLDKVLSELNIKSDEDLEGIVVINKDTVKAISESGTLYTILLKSDKMQLLKSKNIFEDNKKHKLGSLAFDGKYLYTAEKEGKKIFYKFDLFGIMKDTFELDKFPKELSFTVSGMTYQNEYLYVFSEAFSTIFKVDTKKKIFTNSYGINEVDECSGITTDGNLFYLVGDFEKYIPKQYIYIYLT